MTTLVHQLRFEQKVFWRSREAAVFVFIFPLLLYALLGSVYGNEIDGIPAEDVLLVGLFGYGAATTAFGGLAITLVIRREAGVLKRLRATPLQPSVYLSAVAALHADHVCAAVRCAARPWRGRVRCQHAAQLARIRRRDRAGRCVVRRPGIRRCIADPLRGGRVGGRQRRDPPDGVPLGFVRADRRLPRSAAGDRGRAASDVLPRHRLRRVPRRRLALRRPEGPRDRRRLGCRGSSQSPRGASAGFRASAER